MLTRSAASRNSALLARLEAAVGGGGEPWRAFFAPGRVNLLGAHQDYNGGFVLPCAIDRGTYALARPRSDGRVTLRSLDLDGAGEHPLAACDDPTRGPRDWRAYPLGVLGALRRRGVQLSGLDLCFAGDLPRGSGLSSSASLGVVTGLAACASVDHELDPRDLARAVRDGENDYVGVRCGILDPYACLLAEEEHALFIDCLEDRVEHLPFPVEEAALVIVDTGLRRKLTDGRFNDRVAQCEAALRELRRTHPELRALRDLRPEELERARPGLDALLARRATHVVHETPRCRAGAEALRGGDLVTLGQLLEASHESSRLHYEISCPELDFLVAFGHEDERVFGTRLTGAGWGGSTVAIVRRGAEASYGAEVARAFAARFGREPLVHRFSVGGGAHAIRAAW